MAPAARSKWPAVAAAIADEGHAVIQAGTGTGKSLAYLVPTVLSGKRGKSPATKALQDQLADEDLPFSPINSTCRSASPCSKAARTISVYNALTNSKPMTASISISKMATMTEPASIQTQAELRSFAAESEP